MEVMKFVNGFFETEEKKESIPYFVGSKENCRVLMNLLAGDKVLNPCDYYGDDNTSVYFVCNNEVKKMPKKVFDFFVEHGLNAVEIEAPKYTKITNIYTLIAADELDQKFYLKKDGKYMEGKLLDANFIAEDGKKYIAIKVKSDKGWNIRLVDRNMDKAELYF